MNTDLALASPHAVATRPASGLSGRQTAADLTRRQKAAIVVRLLLAEGAKLPLSELPESLQAELTTQISQMRYIDRATLKDVIEEFATELDQIGLAFPKGLDGALDLLEGAISPEMAARLRRQSRAMWGDDPWKVLAEMNDDKLLPLLNRESPEVAAVILAKLKVAKAAALLNKLPGPRARRLTLAMSETADIAPQTVQRIGVALAAELQAEPPRAFPSAAVDRLGAILNFSASVTREDVLEGLDEEDAELGQQVRKAIFTFQDIPSRLKPLDVPNVMKDVDQDVLVIVVAGVTDKSQEAVDFILSNMSTRLADQIREAADELETTTVRQTERAQMEIVTAIRDAVDVGTITMVMSEDEEED